MPDREHLAVLGPDVHLPGWLVAGEVGGTEQRRPGILPALAIAGRGENRSRRPEHRASTGVVGHLEHPRDRQIGGLVARGTRGRSGLFPIRGYVSQDREVPAARAAWLTIVAVCGIAVILLAIDGYAGYAITLGAVGLAAAVNLL